MSEDVKQQVREFYDNVGWKEVSEGVYQNARYEDLRPVSREYIHKCHMRVKRYLPPSGRFLLDAGSGPIQYPEYVTYSEGYEKRVCADISITALKEARKRIGEHGLFVVADITQLPFKEEAFDGAVSLHTIHHLPVDEHVQAYRDVHRVLKVGRQAVLVNGWDLPLLSLLLSIPVRLWRRAKGIERKRDKLDQQGNVKGTHIRKSTAYRLQKKLRPYMKLNIYVWRSMMVVALRFYIREGKFGRAILKVVYLLEELFPWFLGRVGAYPLVVIRK